MEIRKLQYTISYIHVLTFTNHIKQIIAPYFRYEPLEYGIDNDNTLNINIRLVFRQEGFILQFNKEACVLLFEGNVNDVKHQNPIISLFFDIYEKIRQIDGFIKTKSHTITSDSISLLKEDKYSSILQHNNYLLNPFGKLTDFATVLDFTEDEKTYHIQFGNYSAKDINKLNLLPLKVKYNDDLLNNVGVLAQLQIREDITSYSTFSKFKTLLSEAENMLDKYIGNGITNN